jgi:hypothetical protein
VTPETYQPNTSPTNRARPRADLPLDAGTLVAVSDYVIPEPEPKPVDETLSMELQILSSNAVLRGHPSGDERWANCRYYLDDRPFLLLASKDPHPRRGQLVVPMVGGGSRAIAIDRISLVRRSSDRGGWRWPWRLPRQSGERTRS